MPETNPHIGTLLVFARGINAPEPALGAFHQALLAGLVTLHIKVFLGRTGEERLHTWRISKAGLALLEAHLDTLPDAERPGWRRPVPRMRRAPPTPTARRSTAHG